MKARLKKCLSGLLTLALLLGFMPALTLPVSAAAPSSENFETRTANRDGETVNSYNALPMTIGNWTFGILDAAGNMRASAGLSTDSYYIDIATNDSVSAIIKGTGNKALLVQGYYGTDRYLQAKSTSGNEFRLVSFRYEEYYNSTNTIRVIGYRDGVPVTGAVQELNTLKGEVSTVTFSDPAWNNIDEFRIASVSGGALTDDIYFYLDDIVIAAPPTIISVSPNSGPTMGGTSVVITGDNFTGATAVKFGTTDAASYTVNSATQITATSPAGSAGTVDITVTAPDGTSATSAADQFTYAALNTPPTLTATATNPTFIENAAAVTLFSNVAVNTVEDGQTITELKLTVGGLANGAQEILRADGTDIALTNGNFGTTAANGMSYAVSVSDGTATVTLSKSAGISASAAQTLVSGITYKNTSPTPTVDSRTVTLASIKDSGGTANGGVDTTTLSIACVVSITAVNSPPTIVATISDPTFIEDGAAVTMFSSVTFGTVEAGQMMAELTFAVSGLANGENEILIADGTDIVLTNGTSGTTATNGVSYGVSVSGDTATVTLSSSDGITASAASAILAGIAYKNTSNAPVGTYREVDIVSFKDNGGTANGGQDTTTVGTGSQITIIAVNDAPTLSGGPYVLAGTNVSTTSSATLVSTILAGLTASDAEGAALGIAVTMRTGSGAWQYSTDGTIWTDFGTVSDGSALLLSSATRIKYVPDASTETATLIFRAWDGTSGSASANGMKSTADTSANGGTTAFSTGTAQATLAVTSAPAVSSVSVPANGSYKAGRTLDLTVNFSEAVTVTGTPRIALTIGTATVYAEYLSGSGTAALVFRYTVLAGQTDSDGITVGTLSLNGGTIRDAAGNDATLTLNSVGSTAGILVDAQPPASPSKPVMTSGTDSGYSNTDSITNNTTPTFIGTAETGSLVTLYDTDGTTVLGTAMADASENWSIMSSTLGTGEHTVTARAADAANNISAPSAGLAVTIDTTAPAVSAAERQTPSSEFTNADTLVFRITFSEAVSNVDAADFTVTGTTATVTNVGSLSGNAYDITVFGGDLASLNGAVTIGFAGGQNITDIAGNALTGSTSGVSYIIDNTNPAAGNSGQITTSSPAASSVTLNWTAATDTVTAAAGLQYKVVYSASNNISTVSDALANGTVAKDWTAALGTQTVTALSASTSYYFNVLVQDAAGNRTAYTPVAGTTTAASSGDTSSGTSGNGASVIVNGQSQTAGTTATSTNAAGQTVTTVTVDTAKLENILAAQGDGATVIIPVTGGSDAAMATLTGAMLRSMEDRGATLVLQTASGSYTLPTSEIDMDAVAQQLGSNSLADIRVTVSISEPSAAMARVVENAAQDGGYTIMIPAVDYTITCTYGNQSVTVGSFNSYVERTVAIPDGVDPSKITTGVAVDPDGTVRHVPTRITLIGGKYYAVLNSLTNSTYSVIWNPVTFSDVASHWAKDTINNMGSRMIVTGVGDGSYAPGRSMTRAEFAAIIVRALGLEPETGESGFRDVASADWYGGYVKTAAAYGIITGYGGGSFKPGDKITREQAMTMLSRAMTITGLNGDSGNSTDELLAVFTDASSVSAFAKDAVAACLKTGVANGTSAVTLSPQAAISRAEVAVMVERLLEKSGLI